MAIELNIDESPAIDLLLDNDVGADLSMAEQFIITGGGALRPATTESLGGIIVGEDLQITRNGTLSIIKADRAEQDNTHPITAAAVFMEIGNIDALLQTI